MSKDVYCTIIYNRKINLETSCSMEYYTAIIKNEVDLHVLTCKEMYKILSRDKII